MLSFKSILPLALGLLYITAVSMADNCSSGVHMIVARESLAKPGMGLIGAVAQSVQQQIPGSDIVAVDYPAQLNPQVPSEAAGVAAMSKLVADYVAACPMSKIVLMGYSQFKSPLAL